MPLFSHLKKTENRCSHLVAALSPGSKRDLGSMGVEATRARVPAARPVHFHVSSRIWDLRPRMLGRLALSLSLLSASASLVRTDRWTNLARRLPAHAGPLAPPALAQRQPADRPAAPVTLYRDTNGWCPFCERVWLQLQNKGVPYEEVLINLQDKPQWYKDMVPTQLVRMLERAWSPCHLHTPTMCAHTRLRSHSGLHRGVGPCRQNPSF